MILGNHLQSRQQEGIDPFHLERVRIQLQNHQRAKPMQSWHQWHREMNPSLYYYKLGWWVTIRGRETMYVSYYVNNWSPNWFSLHVALSWKSPVNIIFFYNWRGTQKRLRGLRGLELLYFACLCLKLVHWTSVSWLEHFRQQQFDPTSHLKEVVFSSNIFQFHLQTSGPQKE